jgi:2-oxoisovalerate dehydrogenase E1 component
LSALAAPTRERESLLDLYRQLVRIRVFEDKATELFLAGHVKGTAHSCVGQEAIAVGLGAVLRHDDYIAGHHRSHGHLIAKGAQIEPMFAELLGRRTGYCKGLGGSMHIADLSLGVLGCNGIVGASMPLATGAALSSVVRGTDQVSVAFFGDGGANQGLFHEAVNLAAVWKLPVVFVCENNQFQLSATWQEVRSVECIADRAAGYGIPGELVDGNDVLAVEEAARRHVDAARRGEGPSLIEAKTYRRRQHSMRANLPETRDMEEAARWEALDPIGRFEEYLLTQAGFEQAELELIQQDAVDEMDTTAAAAMEAEYPTIDDLRISVYSPHRAETDQPPAAGRSITYLEALREAMILEMEADENVIVIGEDVAALGGIFQATSGLYERFGPTRVRNTPIAEGGFVATAVGAALTGLRPIVEIQIFDFVTLAMDAIVNQAAKLRFMMGGTPKVPLVVRGPAGGGVRLAAQHSQSLEAWFAHVPGLVVLAPSDPADAKGLLAAAIRDDNPVIFIETKSLLFTDPQPVPEERYAIQIGKAAVKRTGDDITIVATQAMVPQALRAAVQLEQEGISAEVIDPRSLYPLDEATILESVAKTSRAIVAHEAVGFAGIGAEIAAMISNKGFFDLDAPVARVAAPHWPMPYAGDLEAATIPTWRSIVDAIRQLP